MGALLANRGVKMAANLIRTRGLKCTYDEWKMIKSGTADHGLSVREFIVKAVQEKLKN